jgi:hypothetical protein
MRLAKPSGGPESARVVHPLALYGSGGSLTCRACARGVSEALWLAHLASGAHKEAVAALRGAAAVPSAAPAPRAPAPVAASAPVAPLGAPSPGHPPASLPVGFFDDAREDALAHGVDPDAVVQAALSDFLSEVQDGSAAAAAAAAEEAEEQREAENRAEGALEGHALYRARLALLREGVDLRVAVEAQGEAGAGAAGSEAARDSLLIEEHHRGSSYPMIQLLIEERDSLLVEELLVMAPGMGVDGAAPGRGADAVRNALAKRRRLLVGGGADAEGDEEEEVADFCDWRRKGR